MLKEKAQKPTEVSLGGVGKDKKPSAAENFSRRIKNATYAANFMFTFLMQFRKRTELSM
jgi:hypothetical protein